MRRPCYSGGLYVGTNTQLSLTGVGINFGQGSWPTASFLQIGSGTRTQLFTNAELRVPAGKDIAVEGGDLWMSNGSSVTAELRINSGGVFRPGETWSNTGTPEFGSVTINGDFTMLNTGKVVFRVQSGVGDISDKLHVTSTAYISSAAALQVITTGVPASGDHSWKLWWADAGITGDFTVFYLDYGYGHHIDTFILTQTWVLTLHVP